MNYIGIDLAWTYSKESGIYNQLKQHPEKVKDELLIFVGEIPNFKMLEDYLPKQKGNSTLLLGQ